MRVGVIGGGQLARMMIPPAVALGIDLRVLAEADGQLGRARGDRGRRLSRRGRRCSRSPHDVDVVTFDHEHVPQARAAPRSSTHGRRRAPRARRARRRAGQAAHARAARRALGVPVPDWAARRTTAAELDAFLARSRRAWPS